LSGRGLCDELITRPEESYRLCCVVVCDLETSRMGAPYIYDISHLRVKSNTACYMFRPSSNNVAMFFSHGPTAADGPGPPHYRGFTTTFSHATLRRAPLDRWSAGRRDLYLTRHNTHKRQTSMPSAGFKPAIPSKRAALDRAAIGNGPPIMHFNT